MVYDSTKQYQDYFLNPFVIKRLCGGKEFESLVSGLSNEMLLDSPVFSINNNIVNALMKTKSLATNALPFDNLVIMPEDMQIEDSKGLISIKSIFLARCICSFQDNDSRNTIIPKNRNQFNEIFNIIKNKDASAFETIFCYVTGKPLFESETNMFVAIFYFDALSSIGLDRKADEKILSLTYNFINFLNNPEVSFIEHSINPIRNFKRANKGKLPLPNKVIIKINGKLKIYLENYERESKNNPFSFRFWVRGHFRHLNSEQWKNKKGETIWIVPYIKGKGILVNKTYEVVQ